MTATVAAKEVPRLSEMTPSQCEDLLSRNTVGRLAFTYQGRVNVIPIHYATDSGWIYGRTSPGAKLEQMLRDRRIAFEVDEYSGYFDWSSVVVQGTFYIIDHSPRASAVFDHALSVLRRVFPETLTDDDPVPFRTELFRISVARMTGRSANPEGGAPTEADKAFTRDAAVAEEDRRLRNEIITVLGKLEDAGPENVGVDVLAGVVVLRGIVETFSDIAPIERAIVTIPRAKVVLNEIEVGFTRDFHTEPLDLANAVLSVLDAADGTSEDVHVVIETGWLRAEGVVAGEEEHQKLIRTLRQVRGARGLVDRIRVG